MAILIIDEMNSAELLSFPSSSSVLTEDTNEMSCVAKTFS